MRKTFFNLGLTIIITLVLAATAQTKPLLRKKSTSEIQHQASDKDRAYSNSAGYLLPEWFSLDARMTDNYIFV